MSKSVVLMTGAGGVIGSRVAADLARDYSLKLTDVNPGESPAGPGAGAGPGAIEPLDIVDFDQTLAAMQGVEMVVHMAIASRRAMLDRPMPEQDDIEMKVNVLGTQHVFEAARQAGVRRIVFASSMTTLLGNPRLKRADADTPPRPSNLYACTKLFGEHLAEYYSREHGLPVICLRFGQPYPILPRFPYKRLSNPQHRSMVLGFEDITESIRCGLREDGPSFAVVNVLSESDSRTFELTGADAIGYRPRQFFTENGPIPNHMQETPA